jgi:hypothetical protein
MGSTCPTCGQGVIVRRCERCGYRGIAQTEVIAEEEDLGNHHKRTVWSCRDVDACWRRIGLKLQGEKA